MFCVKNYRVWEGKWTESRELGGAAAGVAGAALCVAGEAHDAAACGAVAGGGAEVAGRESIGRKLTTEDTEIAE